MSCFLRFIFAIFLNKKMWGYKKENLLNLNTYFKKFGPKT